MTRSRIYAYIYIFFLLFGPKIGGYVDTSVIASLITIVIFLQPDGFVLRVEGVFKRSIPLLIGIIGYSLIVSVVNTNFDITYYGRLIRTIFSLVGISVFVKKSELTTDELKDCLINVLLLHALTVIITATVYVEGQQILKSFTGYDKHIRQYRSTGLMAGFDMAGLICNLGIVLLFTKQRTNILKYIIFVVAVIYTSRFSIVSLCIVLLLFVIIMRNDLADNVVMKGVCIGTLVFVGTFVIILLLSTTSNVISSTWDISSYFPRVSQFVETIEDAYSETDASAAWDKYFNFSVGSFQFIFGKGVYGGGDPGYVKIINAVGVVGLIMILAWHWNMFRELLVRDSENRRLNRTRIFLLICLGCVLIGLNFKNCYFFTGTFFEIMVFILYGLERSYEEERKVTVCTEEGEQS